MALLSSRERVRRALNHQEPDRVPIDIGGIATQTTFHRDAYKKMQAHLGFNNPMRLVSVPSQAVLPDEYIRKRFRADCYPLTLMNPTDLQFNLTSESDGATTYVDEWGIKWRSPQNGLYYDVVGHPLLNCSLEAIEKFNWPDPRDNKHIVNLGRNAKDLYESTEYALIMNGPLYGGIYVPCQWLMGFEEFFIKMMLEPEVVERMLDKIVAYHIGQWDMILDEVGRYIEAVVLCDDLGTLSGPIMNPSIYRRLIKPAHKKIVSFIKSKADVKVIYHCDGAISEFLPDIVEVGFDVLNPIQVSAAGMGDTQKLKNKYGDKLTFWGAGCESQNILTYGSVEEIRDEVQHRVLDLAPAGGLILGSIHNIQKEAPVQNVVAFYDALFEMGSKIYK